jgi:riboflavin kinase/FMN adenylyltransferase
MVYLEISKAKIIIEHKGCQPVNFSLFKGVCRFAGALFGVDEPMALVIQNFDELHTPIPNPVLTIGNFDGVHRGHLSLFEKVKTRAAALNGTSCVMTFDPHPLSVMKPDHAPPLITPTRIKLELIEKAGIDVIFCVPFTPEFAALTARRFIEEILVGKIGIREIVAGYDYSFGRGREGNVDFLRKEGERLGFVVHQVGPVFEKGIPVSSTAIRSMVKQGLVAEANGLLGRPYMISGTVVKGENRGGRLLGFPTANLATDAELIPAPGVYAVRIDESGTLHNGVTNIGFNPTFGNTDTSIETHVLDFSGDLLGASIRLLFISRLRDERQFPSIEALSHRISEDVKSAREILA